MQGRRIYPDSKTDHLRMAPGDYGLDMDGMWWIRAPRGSMGAIPNHEVTEHEDGTITVSPSILLYSSDEGGDVIWHGYLERGVWREC
jgi:hypothetical protein